MKWRLIIICIAICLFVMIPAICRPVSGAENKAKQITYPQVSRSSPQKIADYSGKTAAWEGTLKKLVSNEAYFEYVIKLSSGDEITALSDRGLQFREGDYINIEGFIMIRDGRFSHLVIQKARLAMKPIKPLKPEFGAGMYALDMSDQAACKRIVNWILYYNGGIAPGNASYMANRIVHHSRRNGLDPFLVTAIISAESAFNASAISVAGAIGLGQLMPGTAASLGVNAYDPDQNIAGSARYLKCQLDRWGKSGSPVAFALASYNAGPGAVIQYGGIPPYRETIDYVNIVTSLYMQIMRRR